MASAAGGLIEVADSDLQADELPEVTLTRGLHEITNLLVTEYTLDDILRVILETMYRALGVGRTRAFFLLKDPAAPVVRFRFGLGQSASEMRAWLEVPVGRRRRHLRPRLHRQKDLVVKDSAAEEIMPLLPEWYRQLLLSRRFVVSSSARRGSEATWLVLHRRRPLGRKRADVGGPELPEGVAGPGGHRNPSEKLAVGATTVERSINDPGSSDPRSSSTLSSRSPRETP